MGTEIESGSHLGVSQVRETIRLLYSCGLIGHTIRNCKVDVSSSFSGCESFRFSADLRVVAWKGSYGTGGYGSRGLVSSLHGKSEIREETVKDLRREGRGFDGFEGVGRGLGKVIDNGVRSWKEIGFCGC